jgi:hypothetical protein
MLKIRPYVHSDVYDIELDYEFDAASRAGLLGHNEIVAYTLLDDDKVLAVGGAHVMWFGAGEAWVLVSPECLGKPASFARYAKKLFDSILQDTELRRVQASIHVDDDRAYRFAEWLGFENEGVMRKYGVDGGDYYRMARVA